MEGEEKVNQLRVDDEGAVDAMLLMAETKMWMIWMEKTYILHDLEVKARE